MKKGQVYEGIVEKIEFPNKGIVIVEEEDGKQSKCIVKNAETLMQKIELVYYSVFAKYIVDCNDYVYKRNKKQKRIFLGHTDLDLTELGYSQADCVAQYFDKISVDAIYSSDLIRAQNTIIPLSKLVLYPFLIHIDLS